MMISFYLIVFIVALIFVDQVKGHGRLIDPPARPCMWRFGYNTPVSTDDMALYCGGFNRQWNINRGRCGVCGDPFDGPRDNEAGGKYAKVIIVKHYRSGETISVAVELTRSHLGWFEFRLCPHNNPSRPVTHQCLNSNLLRLADGSTRYKVTSWDTRIHHVTLRLPKGLTCSQCVLQWKYNAGNSWGCEGRNTGCCVGCGHQEQFYGCADIAVSATGTSNGNHLARPQPATNNNNQHNYNINHSNNVNNNNNHQHGGIGFVPVSLSNHGSSNSNTNNYNHNSNHNTTNNLVSNALYSPSNNNNHNNGGQGFIPINGFSHNSAGSSSSGNSVSSGNADYATIMRCKGVMDVYTQWCRRNCLRGSCLARICTPDCLLLVH